MIRALLLTTLAFACSSPPPPAAQPTQPTRPTSAPAAAGVPTAPPRTPAELIEQYEFDPDCGFRTFANDDAYRAALAHNNEITAQLKARGEAAVATCREHLGDTRNIFTGDGGPPLNVAVVCRDVLASAGHPVEGGAPFTFCSTMSQRPGH